MAATLGPVVLVQCASNDDSARGYQDRQEDGWGKQEGEDVVLLVDLSSSLCSSSSDVTTAPVDENDAGLVFPTASRSCPLLSSSHRDLNGRFKAAVVLRFSLFSARSHTRGSNSVSRWMLLRDVGLSDFLLSLGGG